MNQNQFKLLLIASFFIANTSFAQKDSSGIYKTADDFKNRKLSYAINYKTEKHKINSYVLFKGNVIKVKHQGTAYKLTKSDTYGYRNTEGVEYRFIDNKEYRVLNPGEAILIYIYQYPAHSGKEAAKYVPVYFFTTDAGSAPQDLTKGNIKAAFPQNHKLHDAIDAQFVSDLELHEYDSFHKTYKLNRIINSNIN
jgi:hypothetical protein